ELLLLIAGVSQLPAQGGRDVDLRLGRWYQGNQSTTYELRTDAPLAGIFSHGLTAQVLIHDSLARHHAIYGAGSPLHAWRRRSTRSAVPTSGAGPQRMASIARA